MIAKQCQVNELYIYYEMGAFTTKRAAFDHDYGMVGVKLNNIPYKKQASNCFTKKKPTLK